MNSILNTENDYEDITLDGCSKKALGVINGLISDKTKDVVNKLEYLSESLRVDKRQPVDIEKLTGVKPDKGETNG